MRRKIKWLIYGSVVSIIIIVSYYLSANRKEWFMGADSICAFVVNLAESFVAGALFVFVVDGIQYFQNKKRVTKEAQLLLVRILYSLGQLLKLVFNAGKVPYENQLEKITLKDLDDIEKINDFEFDSRGVLTILLWCGKEYFPNPNDEEWFIPRVAFIYHAESILSDIEKLSNKYDYLSDELIKNLEMIKYSDFLEAINKSSNNNEFFIKHVLKRRLIQIYNLYANYKNIMEELEKDKWPMTINELLLSTTS